jgi:hypothetical protein
MLTKHTPWLRFNYDDVEEAILGDYWGDTLRDIYAWKNARES